MGADGENILGLDRQDISGDVGQNKLIHNPHLSIRNGMAGASFDCVRQDYQTPPIFFHPRIDRTVFHDVELFKQAIPQFLKDEYIPSLIWRSVLQVRGERHKEFLR